MEEKRSKVIVIPCDSYDEEKVYNCIKTGLEHLGGFTGIVKAEEKILQ